VNVWKAAAEVPEMPIPAAQAVALVVIAVPLRR
jgi:hypothetical protein